MRFREGQSVRFGMLQGEQVRVCEGDMFVRAVPTTRLVPLADVELLIPVQPSKVIALWNNFHALGK